MSKRGSFNFPTSGTSFNEARSGVRGNDPDFLYYNAQIINNSTATTSKTFDPSILYQDTRSVPILHDKSSYAVSVENFTLNGAGKNLPVFIPQIREYNSDGSKNRNPNNTVYDVTFTAQYGGTKESPLFTYQSTRSVQWEPENKATWIQKPPPNGVYEYPQPEIPYYYCYTYSHWVSLVNKALALAWGDVISAAKNGGVPGLSIVINSLSGSTCVLEDVVGDFVVGATVTTASEQIESVGQITSLSPFTIDVISGNFYDETDIIQDPEFPGQLPGVDLATATIATIKNSTFLVGQPVECRDPDTLALVGTGTVVSYEGNTVVVYNIDGTFTPGFLLNQEPDVGTARITSTSIYEEITIPGIELGTKCPFYTYDSKTNLFSLWLDSNTSVVPFGSSVPSPSPLSVFGASTASGYVPGEYSFVGYNTNFESLFTNFNATYYSDQVPLAEGASITSPTGVETISQATVVNTDGAQIVSFPDFSNQMTVQWSGSPISVAGSNWTFASPLVSASQLSLVAGSPATFLIDSYVAKYVQEGFVFEVTASNGRSASGYVTDISRSGFEITDITLQILSTSVSPCSGSGWKFTLPIDSVSFADPFAGIPVSLVTDVYPYQTPIVAGHNVLVTGPQGQEFTGSVSSFTETISYTAGSGVADEFVTYENSTLPLGFNPVVSFQAQTGTFVEGDIVQGKSSNATGKIVEVTAGNQGTQNTLKIIKQSGAFAVGDTWSTSSASGTIVDIDGPNSASQITRSGLMTVANTYLFPVSATNLIPGTSYTISFVGTTDFTLVGASSNTVGVEFTASGPATGTGAATSTYYSGPFNIGDTIEDVLDPTNSAVITAISGDNGYTTVTYSSQKNPFVIGHQVESYVSLSNTAQSERVCSGTVVDVIGENLGYGTVNVGNQNGQFGIGEVIVNNFDNSVATIVSIAGPNNGYGTVSYINQLTTGAPGAFIPGEFLLFADTLDAFGKVILDTPDVMNQTQGNIGSVTVITGVEINGLFTPTANVPLPTAGQEILGSLSGTVADFGGIVYLDSAVLTVNNVCGSFNVGDLIVDNVGFGLASSAETISVTATCNGFSYLGTGKLVLKNTLGGATQPASFNTSNILIDFDSSNPPTQTNAIAMNIVSIPENRQFINGDPVRGGISNATGVVVANCGSFPYPSVDSTSQLLTILPDENSPAFQEGETLYDDRPSATLGGLTSYNGPFITGDLVTSNLGTATLLSAVVDPESSEVTLTLTAPESYDIPVGSTITGQTSGTTAKVKNGTSVTYIVNTVVGTFLPTEVISWSASGNVFSQVPLNNVRPNTLFLTNVNGVFYDSNGPSGTVSVTNISRELIMLNGRQVSFDEGGAAGVFGTWVAPQTGDYLYNWNTGDEILCMEPGTVSTLTNSQGRAYNIVTGTVLQKLDQTIIDGNTLGVLPFIQYPTTNPLINPCGINVTVTGNDPGFAVGNQVYFFNGGTVWSASGAVVSIEQTGVNSSNVKLYTMNLVMFAYENASGGAGGVNGQSTNAFTKSVFFGPPASYIHKINYYTNGFGVSTVTLPSYQATALYDASTSNTDTDGVIASIKISSSSAYVQTSKPPASTTALTLTNFDGSFVNGTTVIRDTTTTNKGLVQDFNETTNYTEEATTLTVKSVVGSVVSGALITDRGVSGSTGPFKTATINSVTLANGGFIMQPLVGTLVANEQLLDLGSFATATYTGSTNQTITGLTSDATATVVLDSGSQLKLASITGDFVLETVQSSLGIQADIVGFPLFGVGNTVTDGAGAVGTIVSDSGTELVVKNVQGQFEVGDTLTSAGSTATVSSVSAPTLNIVPYNSTGESSLWTIVPAPLTSTTTATPVGGQQSLFTTNLTLEQTIFDEGDELVVTEVDPILTIEQLYYPENVVQVDLSAGNYSIETLQSLFPSGTTGTQYVVLVQDFESTSSLWSPVASIVIGTQFITVREEYSGTPITIGTGNLGGNATTGSFQKVLLETPIEVLPQESWRGLLYYEQKIEKLSSLGLSKEDLKNLDIQMYWRNRLTNSLNPLTLYNGGSANIRLLFKRIHE